MAVNGDRVEMEKGHATEFFVSNKTKKHSHYYAEEWFLLSCFSPV
jgi:hypothetical protein